MVGVVGIFRRGYYVERFDQTTPAPLIIFIHAATVNPHMLIEKV